MDRLECFLTVDDAARQKSAVLAIVSGAVVGMALELYGQPFDVSAYTAIGVLGAVFTARVFLYCRAVTNHKAVLTPVLARRGLLKGAMAAAALCVLGIIPVQSVEAKVIDRRLRALARSTPLSSEAAGRIADDLDLATEWKIPLSRPTLVQVRDAIKNSAVQAPQVSPVGRPASALVSYARRDARFAVGGEELPPLAAEEARLGFAYFAGALRHSNNADIEADFAASVRAFTSAIEQLNGNPTAKARLLLSRAFSYLALGNMNAAAADAQAAEALGSLDLPTLTLMEGVVLANQKDLQDARRAIGMLTLALQLNADQPGNPVDNEILAYEARSLAYVKLGDYQEALPDSQKAVALAGQHNPISRLIGYRLLIVSYLGLGDYAGALRTANEWQTRAGGAVAEDWLKMVESYPKNPHFVWDQLYNEVRGLGIATPTP